jgi:hypothetical protein
MRFSLLLFLGLIFISVGHVFAQDQDTFKLGEGRFEINGRKPAGFPEIRYLYLEGPVLKAANGRRLLPQPPAAIKGELYGKQKFRIKNTAFQGEFLDFETVAVRGTSFKFSGKVNNSVPDENRVIQPQFTGTLTKFVNGKKAAEAKVTFGYLEPEF